MKSKITIDVDYDNQPVIRIDYVASGDVRDILVKRFLETFAGESTWAAFRFSDNAPSHSVEGVNQRATLRPLMPKDLKPEVYHMLMLRERLYKFEAEEYNRHTCLSDYEKAALKVLDENIKKNIPKDPKNNEKKK